MAETQCGHQNLPFLFLGTQLDPVPQPPLQLVVPVGLRSANEIWMQVMSGQAQKSLPQESVFPFSLLNFAFAPWMLTPRVTLEVTLWRWLSLHQPGFLSDSMERMRAHTHTPPNYHIIIPTTNYRKEFCIKPLIFPGSSVTTASIYWPYLQTVACLITKRGAIVMGRTVKFSSG